jgi:tRNA threonylcarbamoyladenosine biosynthesis protein TsaE
VPEQRIANAQTAELGTRAGSLRLISRDPECTAEAGRLLGLAVEAEGLFLSLAGPLGAGKSVFVRGLAAGLGVDPATVSSPTFALVNQYAMANPEASVASLAHVDFYRLENEEELEGIGFFDLLVPGVVVAVEWGDRFASELPRDRMDLSLVRPKSDTQQRIIEGRALAGRSEAALKRWRESLTASSQLELASMEE